MKIMKLNNNYLHAKQITNTMKLKEFKEITGVGQIQLLEDGTFSADKDWLTAVIANRCSEDKKLLFEMDVDVITERDYIMCVEGVYNNYTKEVESIEYIYLNLADTDIHLTELITDDLLIDQINSKIQNLINMNHN